MAQSHTHTMSHTNLDMPISLHHVFWLGEETGVSGENLWNMGRKCKLSACRTEAGFETRRCDANLLTNMHPSKTLIFLLIYLLKCHRSLSQPKSAYTCFNLDWHSSDSSSYWLFVLPVQKTSLFYTKLYQIAVKKSSSKWPPNIPLIQN